MNRENVIGVVGAVILVAAMVGVFQYERAQAADDFGGSPFDVAWSLAAGDGPRVAATTPQGESSTQSLNVERVNLREVKFTVTWTADQGQNTVRVTVTPPEGSGLTASTRNPVESDRGEITIPFPVPNPAPDVQAVFGESVADAERRLKAQHGGTLGTGEWRVDVEFVEGTGILPLPGLPPVLPDDEVAWTASTRLTYHAADLTARS